MYQTKSLVSIASLCLEAGDTYQAIVYYEKLLALEQELKGTLSLISYLLPPIYLFILTLLAMQKNCIFLINK